MCFLLNDIILSLLILQVVLLQSSTNYGVNGENVTRVTKKWHKYQPIWAEEKNVPPGLRAEAGASEEFVPPAGFGGEGKPKQGSMAEAQARRFSKITTTKYRRRRTTQEHVSVDEPCDYLALNCLRAFQTARVCGRSLYNYYFTFKNYCMLDYVNCRERFQLWAAIHMGDCLYLPPYNFVYYEQDWDSGVMNGYYVKDRDFE